MKPTPRRHSGPRLGELLEARGRLSRDVLIEVLRHQRAQGGRIGTCLVELEKISEDDVLHVLSDQLKVPFTPPEDLRAIDEAEIKRVPEKVARQRFSIPMRSSSTYLTVAMRDPTDLLALDELAFVTGKRIRPQVASEIRILEALTKYYNVELASRFVKLLDRLNRNRYFWNREAEQAEQKSHLTELPLLDVSRGAPNLRGPDTVAESSSASRARPASAPAAVGSTSGGFLTPIVSVFTATDAAAVDRSGARPAVPPMAPATPASAPPAAPPQPPFAPPPLQAAVPAAPPTPAPTAAPPMELLVPAPIAPAAPFAPPTLPPPIAAPPPPAPPALAPAPVAAVPPPAPAAPTPSVVVPAPAPAALPPPVAAPPQPPPASEPAPQVAAAAPAANQAFRLADCVERLARAESRDTVGGIVLEFVTGQAASAVLFMVRRDEAAGWLGFGSGLDQESIEACRVEFDSPSFIDPLRTGAALHRGELAELPSHAEIRALLGTNWATDLVGLPLRIRERLVGVLVLMLEEGRFSDPFLEELARLARSASAALERIVLVQKRGA